MRNKKQLEIQFRSAQRARDIFSRAKEFQYSHEELIEQANLLIWNNEEYKNLSIQRKEYVRGYYYALWDIHWQSLVWILSLDGNPIKSEDVPEGRWCDVKGEGHAYKDDNTCFFTRS